MAYDKQFFKLYAKYLDEPLVRHNHDRVFTDFSSSFFQQCGLPGRTLVIDLGCGLGEYKRHAFPDAYVGVDKHNPGRIPNFIKADYHNLAALKKRLPFAPTVLVSLFSIECCHSAKDKYALYEAIFEAIPSIKHALVSGFFYANRRYKEKVKEAGGVVSWQTIEDPSLHISPTFDEYRLHITTPSAMFGPDVVEVWKFFTRR